VDFFVSYAGPDRPWAEWVAWHLIEAGCSVELDVWDWAVGDNAVVRMNDALSHAGRIMVLYSPAYFERPRFTTDEWTAVMAERPGPDGRHRLVPVRVARVEPPPILAPLVYRDLFGLDETRARAELLTAVGVAGGRPATRPGFPPAIAAADRVGPRVPGSEPEVWNVPARNPAFTGREALLAALRARLTSGDRALVQAMSGMGGVGKTQLAIEYAHLFAGEYDLVWWINADESRLIGEQVAALALRVGWVAPDAVVGVAAGTALERLRTSGRWLLVFDNVAAAAHVRPWLPQGTGHVVITSRQSAFGGVAAAVGVDVFTRPESVALLREQVPALTEVDADRLADALGDLPLALAQAAGLLGETGMTPDEYLDELTGHANELLAERAPAGYPAPLAAAVGLSVDRLGREDPAGLQLLQISAVLAPEPIALTWWTGAPAGALPEPLAATVERRLAFRRTLGRLAGYGLARVDADTLQLHRLTQAVLRDQREPGELGEDLERARRVIAHAAPDDGSDPVHWPGWARLLPHLLALKPEDAGTEELRDTACRALWYLLRRAEHGTAIPLARAWHRHWQETLGPDAHHVMSAAHLLADGYRALGRYEDARRLDEETLARNRRLLGDDHRATLSSANNLAIDLGDLGRYAQARELDEDTVARYRRVEGDDHPDTLRTASNLAIDLRNLGEHQCARKLNEDTLARYRRVLGDDHPDTLRTATNLAVDLRNLGEHEAARDLNEDVLARKRRVLGDDHPATLTSLNNLAIDLRNLGEHERARDLDEDTLARKRRVLGEDHPATLASLNNLAMDLRNLGDHEQARELDEDALARYRRALGQDHPDTLRSASNLAIDLGNVGEREQARRLNEDTLARYRRVLGDDHPDSLRTATNLAADLRELGAHAEAQALLDEVARLRQERQRRIDSGA
jgi:tetratricopeptide (TPR) repeat protein